MKSAGTVATGLVGQGARIVQTVGRTRKNDEKICGCGGWTERFLATGSPSSYPTWRSPSWPFSNPVLAMKRILIFAALLLTVGLSSCQCADKPDIGPVEGDDEQSQLVVPQAEIDVHPA